LFRFGECMLAESSKASDEREAALYCASTRIAPVAVALPFKLKTTPSNPNALSVDEWLDELPPHLIPNPVRDQFDPPSKWMSLAVSGIAWVAIGGLVFGMVLYCRAKRQAIPKTVSLVFDQNNASDSSDTQENTTHDSPQSTDAGEGESDSAITQNAPEDGAAVAAMLPDDSAELLSIPTVPMLLGMPMNTPGATSQAGGIHAGTGSGKATHVGHSGQGNPLGLISGGLGGESVSLDNLSVLYQEIPKYPARAVDRCLAGEVLAEVVINEKGVPIKVVIVSSVDPVFEPEVERALLEWRFRPVVVKSQKVRANFRICFRFVLAKR